MRMAPIAGTLLFVFSSSVWAGGATAAPPDLQKAIWNVFPQSPKCGKSINLKVLSSEHTPDARFEDKKMVAGEIREVWQAVTCDTRQQVRYEFRLGPDKAGRLDIVGFERMP